MPSRFHHVHLNKEFFKGHCYVESFHLFTEWVVLFLRLSVTLKASKTDVFRRGHSLLIARTGVPLCTVRAMRDYFLNIRPPPEPLFVFQSGQLLTRSSVTNLLRDAARCAGLPYQCLKGHIFRIGAASAAAAAGLPDWLIKVLGRWSSDCYQLHICTPQSIVFFLQPLGWPASMIHLGVFQVLLGGGGGTRFACLCGG